MTQDERGFNTIEIIVVILIMSLIALGASMTIFQVMRSTKQCDSHMTALRQVQSAGYWIIRDAQMAGNVITDNLSDTDFLVLGWTVVDDSDNATDHLVTYFFEDLSEGIGKLKRKHSSSAGLNKETLVAQYIYYDPADSDNTSNVSYVSPVLTAKLMAIFADKSKTMEYRVSCRPEL
jgi:type II secretory pathway component PulJ